jgi:hypothetical protein
MLTGTMAWMYEMAPAISPISSKTMWCGAEAWKQEKSV